MERRHFLLAAAGVAAAAALPASARSAARPPGPIAAMAFDAFPVFDPRPIAAKAEQLFPGRGKALMSAWRTRQFEYQWLRALGGQYRDFWQATEDGLVFAADQLGLDLPADKRETLMQGYLTLQPWPDVKPALAELRSMGIRLCFLSNATTAILESGIRNSGLQNRFERVFSTDAVRTFKPDPRAYQLGVDGLGLAKEQILFVAFAGWDVAGAKWFGYPTFWVNRLGLPQERLGVRADGAGRSLFELVEFARRGYSA